MMAAIVDITQQIRANINIVIAVDTHQFQPFQLGSKWVAKVDQLNQLKTVDFQPTQPCCSQ